MPITEFKAIKEKYVREGCLARAFIFLYFANFYDSQDKLLRRCLGAKLVTVKGFQTGTVPWPDKGRYRNQGRAWQDVLLQCVCDIGVCVCVCVSLLGGNVYGNAHNNREGE